jgi:hypothetical protein
MSTTSGKRSVVWLDLEKKQQRLSTTSAPPTSQLSPVSTRPLVTSSSPGPWIDLRSVASSDDGETESVHTIHTEGTTTISSLSAYTPSEAWEIAAGYEKGGVPWYYEDSRRFSNARLSVASLKRQSVLSTSSDIVYPGKLRLLLILISLSLSTLLVALDRTIVSTAMYGLSIRGLTIAPKLRIILRNFRMRVGTEQYICSRRLLFNPHGEKFIKFSMLRGCISSSWRFLQSDPLYLRWRQTAQHSSLEGPSQDLVQVVHFLAVSPSSPIQFLLNAVH